MSSRIKFFLKLLFIVLICGFSTWGLHWYTSLPQFPARGGRVIEGVVGQPHLINPLYADLNSTDRELCTLLFRGLIKYDRRNQPQGNLAESWEIKEDGKVYEIKLKDEQFWHDGEQINADDVVFTYQLTQNEEYMGPEQKTFAEVVIEKTDAGLVKFTLQDSFSPFLENLTLGVLPKHLWENVGLKNLTTHPLNLKPVGSGPAHFNRLSFSPKIENWLNWVEFDLPDAYLKYLRFKFYPSKADLTTALKLGEIDTAVLNSQSELNDFADWPNFVKLSTPIWGQSTVLLYNLRQEKLNNKNVRRALTAAATTSTMETQELRVRTSSPLPRKSWAYTETTADNSPPEADLPAQLTIKTPYEPSYLQAAEQIKQAWEARGVSVMLDLLDQIGFDQTIANYDFEVLLITQESGHDPDQYIYWHSSQVKSPGLNLTGVAHAKLDEALETGRKEVALEERKSVYQDFTKYFGQALPAAFLYHPNLYFLASTRIKSLNLHNLWQPEDRFANLGEWYIKESRPLF